MKNEILSEMSFHPEDRPADGYNVIDWKNVDSEMSDGQRRFISGLVKSVFSWEMDYTFLRMYAPRLLLSSVYGYKYIPCLPNGKMIPSNIAAFQVNKDTRKYIHNLFDVLYMPWETDVEDKVVNNVRSIVKKIMEKSICKCSMKLL